MSWPEDAAREESYFGDARASADVPRADHSLGVAGASADGPSAAEPSAAVAANVQAESAERTRSAGCLSETGRRLRQKTTPLPRARGVATDERCAKRRKEGGDAA